MIAFLNNRFVPDDQAVVSVLDRGFLYGDGLFETILVEHGRPFRARQHWDRLNAGAACLGIAIPLDADAFAAMLQRLIHENTLRRGVIRATLTRGVGPRGYSPKGARSPTLAATCHRLPAPDPPALPRDARPGLRLVTASVRMPAGEPWGMFKTCNKLAQILARAQAEAQDADEALLLDTEGFLAEAASANVFWVDSGTVCTTPVAAGVLGGVTRAAILELCRDRRMPCCERRAPPAALRDADAVFLTSSVAGVIRAASLDGRALSRSPVVDDVARAYGALVDRECGAAR
jgi:aminodeoxychorismate lyase